MESLNKNGVSTTQEPRQEKYITFIVGAFRGTEYFQYDYRHTDGELFSTVAKTLEECQKQRDGWLLKSRCKDGRKYRPLLSFEKCAEKESSKETVVILLNSFIKAFIWSAFYEFFSHKKSIFTITFRAFMNFDFTITIQT